MKKEYIFTSSIDNISIAEKLVDEVSEISNLSVELYGNVLVTIIEAVSNAIKHGNYEDKSKCVRISCEILSRKLVFTIRDEGSGFEINEIPDPTLPRNIERPNGRGVYLMRKLASKVTYSEGGKVLTIVFNT